MFCALRRILALGCRSVWAHTAGPREEAEEARQAPTLACNGRAPSVPSHCVRLVKGKGSARLRRP